MPDCEICGKEVVDIYLVSIDGARMSTCAVCAKSGKVIRKIEATPAQRERVMLRKEEPDIEIVDNYASLVRNGREKLGLSQEDFARKINETLSVMRKIELGKMKPTEKLAQRIERLLDIKIFQQVSKESVEAAPKKGGAVTLGDVVVIRKKE
jgi:putative transcription factor